MFLPILHAKYLTDWFDPESRNTRGFQANHLRLGHFLPYAMGVAEDPWGKIRGVVRVLADSPNLLEFRFDQVQCQPVE